MDKILKEEIDRFRLLSNYDNKKTLDENYKSNEVITEQSWLGNLFKLGGREAGTLSKTAIKEVEELFRLIPTEMKKFGVDAAEVTAKLQSKSFTAKELGEFRKTVFKNITDVKTRKELADDMVKSKAFQDLFTSTKEKKVVDELIKKGYSGDDAKVLIDRYKRTGGKFLDDVKGTIKPKPTKTKAPINPQNLGNQTARKSYAQIAWEILQAPFRVGGFIISNFWKIFWLATSVGVAYYLWNYLNQKYKVYPKCLYRSPSFEDLKRMNAEKVEYCFISETGNEFIDDNGGGRFYIDNKFETDNQKYKGKWSDESDMDVLVTLDNGEKHSLPCEDITDFEDEREKDIAPTKTQTQIEKERILSSWDGKYEKCDDFPMTIGCINDGVIGTVQICLGLPKDGKFSPKVLDALEKEGYGFELSFDIYKTIQSKCGMSSSDSGFASNL